MAIHRCKQNLLSVFSIFMMFYSYGIKAQEMRKFEHFYNTPLKMQVDASFPKAQMLPRKVRSTPFYTETFGAVAGTGNAALPVGWTATTLTGLGTWKWMNAAATTSFSLGALASLTPLDGWIIYHSDSIGNVSGLPQGNVGPSGDIESPTIDCSMHPTVKLSFYELYARFADSAIVQVSDNGGASWTPFVIPENQLLSNNFVTDNPQKIEINITTIAGGKPNVKIRFHYRCSSYLGGYSWLVDDVSLSELDPVELQVSNFHPSYSQGFNGDNSSFYSIPSQLSVPFTLNFEATNFGSNPINSETFYARTYNVSNGFTVNNQNTVLSVPVNTNNMANAMPNPLSLGKQTYLSALSCVPLSDVDVSNNKDTAVFVISDNRFSHAAGGIGGTFTVHRPAGLFNELNAQGGPMFLVPDGLSDTFTHVEVGFEQTTTPGCKVVVDIYKLDITQSTINFNKVATSDPYIVSASEISSSTLLKTATIPIPYNNLTGPAIATSGWYLVSVRAHNATSETIRVLTVEKANIRDFLGIGDVNNNGSIINATNSAYSFGVRMPYINWMFNNGVNINGGLVSLQGDESSTNWLSIAPNPAQSTLSLMFTDNYDSEAAVVITDMFGKRVLNTTIRATSAIDLSSLSPAMYEVSVTKSGKRQTLRFSKL
jgi:hypothetical protein